MIDLSPFPRIKLAQLPTPLQPLKRLSALLDGPTIWIKRDDCTGLALGGNKTRKLEFLMGEAQHQQAELIVTFGAVQSNHVRQTVAACAQLGFPCEPILSRSVDFDEDSYRLSGNLFLDQLLGATIHQVNPEDVKVTFRALLDRESRRVYAIPAGGSNATGSLGYVDCAREISAQVNNLGIEIKTLVHATSSAGTQAGLIVGMANETRPIPILGINVYDAKADHMASKVRQLATDVADKVGSAPIPDNLIQLNHEHRGPGYGLPTPAMIEAVTLVAQQEGVLLDPVYSGKAMAALIAEIRAGTWHRDDHVMFLHTGGNPALFAYHSIFQ